MSNIKQQLAQTIRSYHQKGWSPATSTNYSFYENGQIHVSKSGRDKSQFTEDDFMLVDAQGNPGKGFEDVKPSAETLIHCVLYDLFPTTKVILHAHSVYAVLNSQKYESEILFEGYEIQKGFQGQTTHDTQISIPILDNTQDMKEFTLWLRSSAHLLGNHCLVIRNHGTYAWGESLFDAKRHLETLEYLLEINWKLNF